MHAHNPDQPPFTEAAFAAMFASRLSEFHLPWSVFVLRFAARGRRVMGELDDMLLIFAITIAVSTPCDASDGFEDTPGPFVDSARPKPTNAVRLAEMTGIPRETVRRRMLAMAARGWVEQSGPPRREWRLTVGPEGWPRVMQEMASAHDEFLRDLARLLSQWDREACKAGWQALTRPPPQPTAAALSLPVAAGDE